MSSPENREVAFIDRVLELQRPATIQIAGETYYEKGPGAGLQHVGPADLPVAETLHFSSLRGLVDYYQSAFDQNLGRLAFLIRSHRQVDLISPHFGPNLQRHCWAVAQLPFPEPTFGAFSSQESFTIWIQTAFKPGPAVDLLLQTVGVMTAEEVRTSKDDGVSQEVTVKAGAHLTERATVKNPWTLAPYRTFREVEPVESLFVLRVRTMNNEIGVALFPAEGGMWVVDTVEAVKRWIEAAIGEEAGLLTPIFS
jgi:hypothetical protein